MLFSLNFLWKTYLKTCSIKKNHFLKRQPISFSAHSYCQKVFHTWFFRQLWSWKKFNLLTWGKSKLPFPLEERKESEVAQLCPTLCNLMDCSLPRSSVHGIFQARVLEWVAVSFSRGSSRSRHWTQVSHIAGKRFTVWATTEVFPIWFSSVQSLSCVRLFATP